METSGDQIPAPIIGVGRLTAARLGCKIPGMDAAEQWAALAASFDELADEIDRSRAVLVKLKATGRHPELVAELEAALREQGESRATLEAMRDDALRRSRGEL